MDGQFKRCKIPTKATKPILVMKEFKLRPHSAAWHKLRQLLLSAIIYTLFRIEQWNSERTKIASYTFNHKLELPVLQHCTTFSWCVAMTNPAKSRCFETIFQDLSAQNSNLPTFFATNKPTEI